jgi:hypothetical protein
VLADDVSGDARPVSASVVSLPTYGTLDSFSSADGKFQYTRLEVADGADDSFVYEIVDSLGRRSRATVLLLFSPN